MSLLYSVIAILISIILLPIGFIYSVGKKVFIRICSNLIKKEQLVDSNGDPLVNDKGEVLKTNKLNRVAVFLNRILNLIEGNGH